MEHGYRGWDGFDGLSRIRLKNRDREKEKGNRHRKKARGTRHEALGGKKKGEGKE